MAEIKQTLNRFNNAIGKQIMDIAMALKLHRTGHSQTSSSKRANERDKSRSKCDDQYTRLNKFTLHRTNRSAIPLGNFQY